MAIKNENPRFHLPSGSVFLASDDVVAAAVLAVVFVAVIGATL